MSVRRLRTDRWGAATVVGGLTVVAFVLRLVSLDQGLFGDELSTAWIVHGRSLGRVISLVYSDAEVTPPLSFALAWASQHLGSSWDWLRLPSLLAGTATVPIVYGIGVRTVGRTAGLLAAAICTLSGVMVLYSTEARNYAMLMACVALSTLAMLLAIDTGRRRWWALYAVASCLAMYSHYSAAFVLIAQLLWLLWAHPEARRGALIANVGAAVGFAPWIPGWIKDTHSVTIPIINALLPFTFSFVRRSATEWAFGYPYTTIHQVPGVALALVMSAGVLFALAAVAVRLVRAGRAGRVAVDKRVVLVLGLALATLVGESLYSVLGGHVLDSRNLNASFPGLALAFGALLVAAGPLLGTVASVLLLSGYFAAAVDSLRAKWQRPHYPAVASYISSRAGAGDVVIDASIVAPVVPLTSLDAYLPQVHPEFRLGLPEGPPPYTLASKVPDGPALVAAAAKQAAHARIFVVFGAIGGNSELSATTARLQAGAGATGVVAQLQREHYRVETERAFPGIESLAVLTMVPATGTGP